MNQQQQQTQNQENNFDNLYYATDSEDALIGIILSSPELLPLACDLSPNDFTHWQRQDAWAAILKHDADLGAVLAETSNPDLIAWTGDAANHWYDATAADVITQVANIKQAAKLRRAGFAVESPIPDWGRGDRRPVDLAAADAPRRSRIGKRERGGSLARSIFKANAEMVAPAREHFTGDYPGEIHQATCKTHWQATIHKADNGHTIKARGVRFSVLHDFTTKGGKLIFACPHCLHERTIQLCQGIESAALNYIHENHMRHVTVSDKEAKQIADKLRQRNKREHDNHQTGNYYSVIKVPQHDGQTWLLHDDPDTPGEALPTDRKQLYKLTYDKVKNTPKGRRGWRGLSRWGMYAEKQKSDNPGDEAKKQASDFVARIMGENWGKFAQLMRGYFDYEGPLTRKGVTFEDCDLSNWLQFLEDAGLDFAVIEGELSQITHKTKDTCLKCDNEPKTAVKKEGKQAKQAEPLPF